MTGRRVPLGGDGCLPALQPGDYARALVGEWLAMTPNGLLAGLRNHQVVEHEDGTISVSPSILVRGTIGLDPRIVEWHGFLERGVWRSC